MASSEFDNNPFLSSGLASTTLHPLGLKVVGAEGCWLHLSDGRRVFDAISGIGVSSFGHKHPTIHGALQAQLDSHLHTMVYGEFVQSAQHRASALLRETLPSHLDSVYFVNSGAEAIDAALKLAKRLTGRRRILAVQGGYHGNTHGALSVSSNEARKAPYRPLLPEVEFLNWNSVEDLERIDESVACVVAETVQGDAGVRIPDRAWLQAMQARCRATGAKLILDEIQCGMGRTGRPWALDHFEIQPDMVCMGKALGGGMPIGALAASTSDMAAFAHSPSLGHITTFGGHPMACAGAIGALTCMSGLDWEHVEQTNRQWQQALQAHPAVRGARRIGAFHAVELTSPDQVQHLVEGALTIRPEMGLLAFWFLSVPHAFRLAPPLNASEEDMNLAMAMLIEALDRCV